ncbi:hypothetical protein SUGI_1133450 [Cryptomeria japonica]|uniref:uncharacterized protein LOC131036953 isoform X2 n=1 Tax=Cryptomeria japonica TaxID=3369 RepID=UPI00241468A5|nr:uncharacterized protein LOC131036953 isoform X2 [Cryptomeria japonica]GLJ53186.1 hypothetical protein SUGI_1133450 [Cryptomeria japonica]
MAKNGERPSIDELAGGIDELAGGIDELAEGIAAHLLNPKTNVPITVGISGECGSGGAVSNLMDKIKEHLLLTSAQAAFPGECFDGENQAELSEKGRRLREGVHNLLAREDKEKHENVLVRFFKKVAANLSVKEDKEKQEDVVLQFLEEYQSKHKAVYKYLACIELNQLVKHPQQENKEKLMEIPRVLTVNFSVEDNKGEHEACDGLVVEITEEIEKSMTRAQRWITRWRHKRASFVDKYDWMFWGGAFLVAYLLWLIIKHFNFKNVTWGAIVAFASSFIVPVVKKLYQWFDSKEVSQFVKDHFRSHKSDQYGHQETVISKLKFLKKDSGKKPWPIFSFFSGLKLGLMEDKIEGTPVPKYGSAPHKKLRIIAFMDGLDRYEDSMIVRVLQSLNTVVKACEINFVLALDKNIIRKAFKSSSQKEADADHLISQLIQLPVTLVHPDLKPISEMSGNTTNDIEKQQPCTCERRKNLRKRVTRVQHISTMMTHDPEEMATFKDLNRFGREIPGLHQNYIKYHNFARNVISQVMYLAPKSSWQWDKELVAWIFICSQWREEMNILIQDWHAYIDFIDDENRKAKQEPSLTQDLQTYADVKEKKVDTKQKPFLKKIVNYIIQEADVKGKKEETDSEEKGKKEADSQEEKNKEKLNKLKNMSNFGQAAFNFEEKQRRWKKLYEALKLQDVSVNGIQFFQNFRFHCDAGYLNCPRELSFN